MKTAYFKETYQCWKSTLLSKFKNDNTKHYINDIIAGLTMGLVRLPLSMAHGLLSELPVEYGIYTDLFGCLFFTLFTATKHNSAGSTAFLMMIMGTSMNEHFVEAEGRSLIDVPLSDKLCFISSITFYTGIIQCVASLLRFRLVNALFQSVKFELK